MSKELSERSSKSKEKLADSLMNTGTNIHSIIYVTIFIAPLTAVVGAFFSHSELPVLTRHSFDLFIPYLFAWTITFYLVALFFGWWLKNKAMNMYDDMSEQSTTEIVSSKENEAVTGELEPLVSGLDLDICPFPDLTPKGP